MKKSIMLIVVLILIGSVIVGYAQVPEGTIVYGCNQIVRSFDPIKAICWEEKSLLFAMYDTLIGYEPTALANWQPRLAKRWEVSEDSRVWTFYLREDARFTTGNLMTSEDIIYSLRRGVEGNFPCYPPVSKYLDVNEGLKAIDDFTVQMTLRIPYAGFGQLLSDVRTGIVDSKELKKHETDEDKFAATYLNDNSIGSGPLKLQSWERGQKIVLVKNEEYWGKKEDFRVPKYERLIDLHVPEPSSQKMMLERGDIDMAFDLTSRMIEEYEKPDSEIKLIKVPIFIGTGIVMNPERVIFQDPLVRRAFRYAINYEEIINEILDGNALRIDRPVFYPLLGYNDSNEFLYSYDLAKAKELMKQSSYPDGGKFNLVIGTGAGFGAPWEDIALKIADDLKEIGISFNIQQFDWSAVDEKQFSGDYDALLMWFTISFPETEGMMMSLAKTEEGGSWATTNPYVNKEVDVLIEKGTVEANVDKRIEIYNKISKIYEEDGIYALIAQQKKPFVFRKNVMGFDRSPNATQLNFPVLFKE